jgi:protein-ribulosamine 3-kinase
LEGEHLATKAIHEIVPGFVPTPIDNGSLTSIPNMHYYLCRFHDLVEELPEPEDFCVKVASLHRNSVSKTGKFGFEVVTYNGDLPQRNDWAEKWEEFFANGIKHMLNLNIERGGQWPEMEALKSEMLSKVIPRLLRPLEIGGRSVKPSLVHGDLWCGNAAVDMQADLPIVYDPAGFFAHNECEYDLTSLLNCRIMTSFRRARELAP